MHLHIFPDKNEMGAAAAARAAEGLRAALAERGAANLLLATGASQFEMLAGLVAHPSIDWARVTCFHLDEYVGLPESHPASFRRYLRERFASLLPLKAFHFVRGDAPDPLGECRRLGELIAAAPVDVACVGIGENGHLAFNDPPADFETSEAYILVDLDAACRQQQVGEGWFVGLEDVPRQAISMSIRQILLAGQIVCTVPDARKAQAVLGCVAGPVTPLCPSSILQRHPRCDLFLDRAAAAFLPGMNLLAAPGWVDLQVNGYAGVDFASPALTVEDVLRAARGLRERGTAAFCPTLVSAAPETYARVLPVLAEAIECPEGGGLLGIHLEGPFISPVDGARGAHPLAHVRPPSLRAFDELYRLGRGKVRLLTLAPELPGALELIRHAVGLGVRVALGHTLAGSREVWAAAEAGAGLATHLGNGLPARIPRHENPLWPLLACPALSAMLITDGHHLPPDFVRVALAVKGAGGLIVTSNSSPAAGLPPGDYEFFGTPARLEADGRLHSPLTGTLAGSSATLGECLAWLETQRLLNPPVLLQVGRANPLAALGL